MKVWLDGLLMIRRFETRRGAAQVLTMTSNKRIMGAAFTNRPVVAALAWAIAAVVCHASGCLGFTVELRAVAIALLLCCAWKACMFLKHALG